MKNFFALLKREFRLFWSNSVLRLLFFGAPILYGILLGYVYQKGKVTDLPILVIDKDQSTTSSQLRIIIEVNEVLHIYKVLPNEQNIDELMVAKDITAVVIIPEHFDSQLLNKENPGITTVLNSVYILTAD